MTFSKKLKYSAAGAMMIASALYGTSTNAVIFHTGDGSIDGSLCVGTDCTATESFGFDTFRLKENNLRIKFQDTSASASFPSNDWEITANDSINAGANYLAFTDVDAGNQPFRVDAGAGANALRVESGGNVGLGTANPVTDLHAVSGNTPTLRLEQDGSSGFTAQTWDMAGNESGFFIRDLTNGSTLPFRIRPGSPSQALSIDGAGIGLGELPSTTLPGRFIQFASGEGNSQDGFFQYTDNKYRFVMADGVGAPEMELTRDGVLSTVQLALTDERVTDNGVQIKLSEEGSVNDAILQLWNNELRFVFADGVGAPEMELDPNGNLTIAGVLTTAGGTCGGGCDAVFDPDYDLPSIEKHAELMFANRHLPNVGPTIEGEPINVSDKLGRMLNELEKAHIYIAELNEQNQELEARLSILESESR